MLMIDGHLDLAMNALLWNRDLRKSAHAIRADEQGMTQKGRAAGTVGFPDMRRGEVAVSFATVIARTRSGRNSEIDFRTHEIAYAHAQGQLAYYRELERQGVLRILADWPAVAAHIEHWRRDPDRAPLGIVLSMEGADPIVEPAQLPLWWDDRLRIVGLAHYGPSAYAYGTESVGGLTMEGRELLKLMERMGVILDVSHLSDDSFWQALDIFHGPVLASHSNCRALVPGDRQLSDDMIRELINRNAVIGAVLDAWMLQPGWIRGVTTNEHLTLDAVVDHIDHICQLAGNARHAAIGSDLDGGYGIEQTPRDLDTIADLQRIPDLLRKRGYTEPDIEAVMHDNWLRLLQRAWTGETA
ncbi:MAG: peptidase [Thermomicrobiales bacterium]|nr:MAG: peptidase [Thermomicrobiales bacterium]